MYVVIAMAIDINSNAYPQPILSAVFGQGNGILSEKRTKKTELRNRKNRFNLLFCLDFFLSMEILHTEFFSPFIIFFFSFDFRKLSIYPIIFYDCCSFTMQRCSVYSLYSPHKSDSLKDKWKKKTQSLWVDVRSRNGVLWQSKAARSNDQCNYN